MCKPNLFTLRVSHCGDDAEAMKRFHYALQQKFLINTDTPVIEWQPRLFETTQDAVITAHVRKAI